jgi:uncharacterized protein YuzE
MKINYDKVADAIYFKIKGGKIAKTISVSEYLNADIDKNGETLGLELLEASSQQGAELEKNIMRGIPIEITSRTPKLA